MSIVAYPVADQLTLAKLKAEIAKDEAARTRAYRRWIAISALLAACSLVSHALFDLRLLFLAPPAQAVRASAG